MTGEDWTAGQPCGKHELSWCGDCRPVVRRGLWESLPPAPLRSYDPVSNVEAAQRYVAARYPPPSVTVWTAPVGQNAWVALGVDPRRVAWWEWLAEVAEPALEAELGPWVCAEWPGRCRGCGGRWEPGELIRRSEGEDAWVCEGCGADG